MDPSSASRDDLHYLFKSLQNLQTECWRNASDPTAGRALDRLCKPVAEMVGCAVAGILQEMRDHPEDPQVQATSVAILRAMIYENSIAARIVQVNGGVVALVQGVQHHPTDEGLLTGALEAIDEIHGLASVLEALDHLKEGAPGARAALGTFCKAAKARWSEAQELPPELLVRVVLSVVNRYTNDDRILLTGLQLLSDFALESPQVRSVFCAAGGWEWLLQVLETHAEHRHVQILGFKLLSSLSKGGAFEGAHTARAVMLLERALCQHDQDDCVLYWALWAVQQLNGARALVAPLRNGKFRTPSAALAALRSLCGIGLGQGDGAGVQDMPAVVDAVVHTMGVFSERWDVLYESTIVLGHVGEFVVACLQGGQSGMASAARDASALSACVDVAVSALMQLISVKLADAETVKAACEALAQILETCEEGSRVRTIICQRLFGSPDEDGSHGEPLLSRVTAAHVSNDKLQTTVMWVTGVAHGAASIVRQMAQHSASHAVQLPAIRTLSLLYGDRIDLEAADAEALPDAMGAVVAAMHRFPENLILQQHACYALVTIVDHGSELCRRVDEEAFQRGAAAAAGALRLVKGRCDGGSSPSSYNALYLRKEATRCIAAFCAVLPSLGQWFNIHGLSELLADALRSTADGVWDGKRDYEVEETLRLELLALSYVLGPQLAILEPLRRWGAEKPAVARAAADAVVELARAHQAAANTAAADLTTSSAATPVKALQAVGCGAELLRAMEKHASDEDLQSRLHLAAGFVNSQGVSAA